jgi:hypothetical protein
MDVGCVRACARASQKCAIYNTKLPNLKREHVEVLAG